MSNISKTHRIVEDWELPNLQSFNNCTVYVDFVIDDTYDIVRVSKVNCEFADPDEVLPINTRALQGVPRLLELEIIAELEEQIDDIIEFIEG
jgi:hypothetical protein